MKVAALSPIPTPYRDYFWRALSALPDVELRVFYASAGKDDRPWKAQADRGYPCEVLSGRNLLRFKGPSAALYWNPGWRSALQSYGPDAVMIGGYNHPTFLSAMSWASRRRIPWFLMSESYERKPVGALKQRVKTCLVNNVVKHASGFFPTGIRAQSFLEKYGADGAACCRIPNVPDLAEQEQELVSLRRDRPRLLAELGLSDHPVILSVGRLVPSKGLADLLKAFSRFRAETGKGTLVIAGDGIEAPRLKQLAEELKIGNSTRFTGFLQPEELLKYYAVAHLFALPSSETWCVAAVEAVMAGLPVIVSDQTGCVADLEKAGVTCRSAAWGDSQVLYEHLCDLHAAGYVQDADAVNRLRDKWNMNRLAEAAAEHIRTVTS